MQRVISVFITIRRASKNTPWELLPTRNLSGPGLSKVGDNEICLFNMRWIALSAPWGSKVYSSLFPSAQVGKRSEYLRNTEMVAKCKRGKFRLVRVENVFITRPDLTTPPPLRCPPLCCYGAVYSCASYCWLSALRKIGSRTYRFILGLRSVVLSLPSVQDWT